MSSNRALGEAYLEDAEYSLEECKRALERGYYHRAVRRAQECVELCLKAILRLFGVEYPRSHDVSSSLLRIRNRLPEWFKRELDFIVEVSTSLALQRAPSFYGDEYRRIPARRLFKKEDAERALSMATRVLELARKLYDEWMEH
ncbi:MAG: DNA-binding protein [Thermoprotei archaeon]|nr:MAG: DNA-binding protein [Thermoprotei archaeon]RLF19622.1 MAG: DNA-binding protein [Thermoprotei archaeon]